jgi:uncharacterized membrane protein YcgQ (UPF0703/DUF1980 family)
MKRTVILLAACLLLALSGCGENGKDATEGAAPVETSAVTTTAKAVTRKAAKAGTGPVEIKEKLFLAQINDIYLNEDEYLGRTIRYEGMFTRYTWEEMGLTYYSVYRRSPGCCGADGQAGFEVIWPEGSGKAYPKENDWVQVAGTLERFEEYGQSYLRIRLDSLTVKKERGAEFVSQ